MMSADAAMESRFRFIIRLIRRNCKTGDGAEGMKEILCGTAVLKLQDLPKCVILH